MDRKNLVSLEEYKKNRARNKNPKKRNDKKIHEKGKLEKFKQKYGALTLVFILILIVTFICEKNKIDSSANQDKSNISRSIVD